MCMSEAPGVVYSGGVGGDKTCVTHWELVKTKCGKRQIN